MEEVNYFSSTTTLTMVDDVAVPEAQKQDVDMSQADINFIVLAVENPNFGVDKPSFEIDISGKPMIDYVINACPKTPTIKRVPLKHNFLREIKPILNNSMWTIVLFSDTPLVTASTISQAFDFASSKGLNVCKLTRGYILKTEYIRRVEEIFGTETYYFEEEDFLIASTFKQLSIIRDIMRNRICEYMMKHGVDIVDPSSTFIGCDVTIGKNTVICPNNKISGKVEIGENCVILSNNTIDNSKLFNGVQIENSRIFNSVIGEDSVVSASNLNFVLLAGKGNLIAENSLLNNVVGDGQIEILGAVLKNTKLGNNIKINNGTKIIPLRGQVRLFGNNEIGVNTLIEKAISIGENAQVGSSQVVSKNIPAIKKFDAE